MNGSALSLVRLRMPIVIVAVLALLVILGGAYFRSSHDGARATDRIPADGPAFYEQLSPAGVGPAFVVTEHGPVPSPGNPPVVVERLRAGVPFLVVEAFPLNTARRDP